MQHEKKKILTDSKTLDELESILVYSEGANVQPLEEDWLRFTNKLRANELSYIDVGGDGNCLFHCLAAVLLHDKNSHGVIREVNTTTRLD